MEMWEDASCLYFRILKVAGAFLRLILFEVETRYEKYSFS